MKRLTLVALVLLASTNLWAQAAISQTTVDGGHPLARFQVDGKTYTGAATFTWPEGSSHYIRFHVTDAPEDDTLQLLSFGTVALRFHGWQSSGESPTGGEGTTLTFLATPNVTLYQAEVSVEYLVKLRFTESAVVPEAECGSVSSLAPEELGSGFVILEGTCYVGNTDIWMSQGTHQLTVSPLPGFAFLGWKINSNTVTGLTLTLNVQSSMTLTALFQLAKRLTFRTEPLGFEVLLDRTVTPTPIALPCPWWQKLPFELPPGSDQLCVGEVDWAVGSQHQVGAPSPQMDSTGQYWVFDSFSNGMENNSYYEVTDRDPETVTATFVRGGRVSFTTFPHGLELSVNGRTNWPSYNFVAAPGETYQLSAPEQQVGTDGRVYVFSGWSNGGEATQEVQIPQNVIENGFRMNAQYELLSQVVISSNPQGTPVEVDGETCQTPCTLDRPDGSQVQVVAPLDRSLSHSHRVEFANWSDGGDRQRTITIEGSESVRLTANYTTMFLLETSSNPASGADFTMAPASNDGFYPKDTQVTVTAEALENFRFRRWGGDLAGTYPTGTVKMTAPRSAIAMLDELPTITEAVVRNAVGETPELPVAAGSIISIYGSDLAPYVEIGEGNLLPQTLAGVTVRVTDRVLALLFVAPSQINAVLPYDLPLGDYTIVVQRAGREDITGEFAMVRNAPGIFGRIFSEQIFALAIHEDGTPITPDSPARNGELIGILGTGFGPYDRVTPYGFALPVSPEFLLVDDTEIFAGDIALEAEFVGGAPGYSGADLLRISITDELPAGSTLEFRIRVADRESNTVLLPIE